MKSCNAENSNLDMPAPKPGPQSRALCGAVCALSITMVLY